MADYQSVEQALTNTTHRASFYNMLQDQYYPKLDDYIANGFGGQHRVIVDFLRKEGMMMRGRRTVAAMFTGNPQSVQFGLEGHILPTASSSTSAQLDIIARTLRYRLQFTEESQQAAKGGKNAAWSAPKAAEMAMARKQMENNIARNLHHGRYNPLSMLDSSSATTALVFKDINERRSTAAAFYALGVKHIKNNMDIMLIDVDDGLGGPPALDISTDGSNRARLSAVSNATPTAPTATSTINPKDEAHQEGDLVVPYGSRMYVATSYSPADATTIARFASMNGIVDFFTNSTLVPYLMGNTRTAVEGLTGTYTHNSGTQEAFTKLMMHLLIRQIREQTHETVDQLIHAQEMFIEIAKEDFQGQRYDAVLGQSGWKNLSFVDNAVELKYREDAYCLPGVIWAYDTSQAGYFEQKPLSPPPGYTEEFPVANYAISQVVATRMGNVCYKRPELGGGRDDLAFDHRSLT